MCQDLFGTTKLLSVLRLGGQQLVAGLAACAKYNPSSNASHARHRMVGVGEKNQQICCIKTDVILEQKERCLLCEFYISKWMSASKWFSIGKTVALLSPLLGVDIQASRCRWLLESVKSWRPQKTWLFWWFVDSQASGIGNLPQNSISMNFRRVMSFSLYLCID